MDGGSFGQLVYLVILGTVLVFWFISYNRQSLNKTLQQVMAWVFIFVGVIAIIGLWEDIRSTVSPAPQMTVTGETIEVPRAYDGHYYLPVLVNGEPINFLVDTGASQIVLSAQDAKRAGIDPDQLNYFGRALTANGEVRTAPVRLETLTVGPITDQNVSAWVNEGELHKSLLGMDYLHRFSNIQFANGRMILSR
ncbi:MULTISPECIES: TIGR02281 family clan AA aspartic protease [unclassified Ruegeria]|uniref:retropepsin-like aspartic protease family protein n=1 Tax=unclassified Ruegeria TaxID=2625375 RepID=UPI001489EF4F|nr:MULTISPECIES: TIGR02281 family clan AA aspartic protease [unclassified Ruegeria]NOD75182.1 TIGR02281 family clan AA aspartic protease [Ruegeria sp. HKCCD4332]NOD87143.1 TIGR02281 family clan AA aspartic protease [Ruegeria sp. HKCCD4318]NOD91255.1 TIGR02281 family clan AA aspartic protease [Ruegeria sp. HKCCD4884]NOE12698.1 TIGR02281 family clan AA aspartic protease [Ruegeria sp. HKCCD4318-2]NOG09137.1 TIGR02281 family clan AA aspartic protease [Ruegeria sp. HKCCD4315]